MLCCAMLCSLYIWNISLYIRLQPLNLLYKSITNFISASESTHSPPPQCLSCHTKRKKEEKRKKRNHTFLFLPIITAYERHPCFPTELGLISVPDRRGWTAHHLSLGDCPTGPLGVVPLSAFVPQWK